MQRVTEGIAHHADKIIFEKFSIWQNNSYNLSFSSYHKHETANVIDRPLIAISAATGPRAIHESNQNEKRRRRFVYRM